MICLISYFRRRAPAKERCALLTDFVQPKPIPSLLGEDKHTRGYLVVVESKSQIQSLLQFALHVRARTLAVNDPRAVGNPSTMPYGTNPTRNAPKIATVDALDSRR